MPPNKIYVAGSDGLRLTGVFMPKLAAIFHVGLGSIRVSQADRANVSLAPELEVDHEIQAGFSIADENLAETYRRNRPLAATLERDQMVNLGVVSNL